MAKKSRSGIRKALVQEIEYYWGLFEDAKRPDLSQAETHVVFRRPSIPGGVLEALVQERILELAGDYGTPGVGEPVEIDLLRIKTSRGETRIRALNRGISLLLLSTPELVRLHRFFGELAQHASQSRSNG